MPPVELFALLSTAGATILLALSSTNLHREHAMSTESAPKNVGEVLGAAAEYLGDHGVENAGFVSKLLMARLLDCKHLELPVRFGDVLTAAQLGAMRRAIKRAAAGEPVQYILGQWDFMGHTFKVDRRALIPRPETELLVETVLACDPLWAVSQDSAGASQSDSRRPLVVDIGTGSGCILISLALARGSGTYMGLDTSEEAITLARENAERLGVADRVTFACAELGDCMETAVVDAIVANLPYIPTGEIEGLSPSVRDFEPRSALDGGEDGLRAIEACVQDACLGLREGGFLFLEIGDTQGEDVQTCLREAGFGSVALRQDLNGHDRVVSGVLGPAG